MLIWIASCARSNPMNAFCIRRKEMKKKSWSCAFLGMNPLVHRVGALLVHCPESSCS